MSTTAWPNAEPRGNAPTPEPPETADAPSLHLPGFLAPVPDEIDAVDLPVAGTLPPELSGRYLRNGPNPAPGEPAPHWFVGSGMVHGVRIHAGRAEWYRNRWVRTRGREGAPPVRPDGSRDLAVNSANTHVIEHAGRLLALCEGGLPYQLDNDLDTVGPYDFDGALTTAMTAHPKQDPVTGELYFFGYGVRPPYVTYHRLSTAGTLDLSVPVEVPGPTMMHDFAITAHHVVWLDLPLAFDHTLVARGMPYRWNDDYGARLGVMDRDGRSAVRWFEIDPCYVFHVGNAREDAEGRIVLDAVRYDRQAWNAAWSGIGGSTEPVASAAAGSSAGLVTAAAGTGVSSLHRWVLDPATGRAHERRLDDQGVEFPTIDDARTGLDNRYLYAVSSGASRTDRAGVVKYDVTSMTSERHELAADLLPGEAVFVPAGTPGNEDDGWLLTIVTDRAGRGSELLVLDATDVTGPAVASIRLPRKVPAGFHGSWIPDSDPQPLAGDAPTPDAA
ncbi:carotenoid oxygenase family protein [Actinopolymorpha pittospori]